MFYKDYIKYTIKKDFSNAIEEYNNVLQLDNKNPKAHKALADIYYQQGNKKLALKELELYIKYEPIKSYHERQHIEAIMRELKK